MLAIKEDLFVQETEKLKSIWEELNPIDDRVDNELFDLIDKILQILFLINLTKKIYYKIRVLLAMKKKKSINIKK